MIHPVGWSHLTGHDIEATDGRNIFYSFFIRNMYWYLEYKNDVAKMVEMNSYPANVATAELFNKVIKRRSLLGFCF